MKRLARNVCLIAVLLFAQGATVAHEHSLSVDPLGFDCDICLQLTVNDGIADGVVPGNPVAGSVARATNIPAFSVKRQYAPYLCRAPPRSLIC